MKEIGINAKKAEQTIAFLSNEQKNDALKLIAKNLNSKRTDILEENKKDVENGVVIGLTDSLLDRLTLDDARIDLMIQGLEEIASMADPLNRTLSESTTKEGLSIRKTTVPLGVIGIIYESRPNVTLDSFALCFKAGNAVVLKGGKEAIYSNTILESIIRDSLSSLSLDPNIIQVIKRTDREATNEMMRLNKYIDVLIPRGSAGLIKAVVENSTIPVIQTGDGNCHIYIDNEADIDMSIEIIKNAKMQRMGVCNALESLVIHIDIAEEILPLIESTLVGVHIHADAEAMKTLPNVTLATEEDFYTEYLGPEVSIKTVSSLDEAITHINEHNTKHSEAIITRNREKADEFTKKVDASTVYVNASTRFTDGSVFGLGAEIGISTQKLHARGPMGVDALCSYKYIVEGTGQIR
ncbi:MAG: glutamate-5-semialdehyde dehydrogenase [Erysipelothrix sp.]|nr:glutamate-5-semialdehyde dehydrogenase [Erysipelothrix sp.]